MRENISVSVITAAYNAEKYIAESIDSVLKQSQSNFEIIVVDDGSTDSTAQIVDSFISKEPRITLIRQKNAGVSAARNAGFANSSGKYIAYLDSDDVWKPNHLDLLLSRFEADKNFGIVHGDCEEINEQSLKTDIHYHGHEGYLLNNILMGGKWINGPSGSLVSREAVKAVGGFDTDLSNGEDLDFFIRIAAMNYQIGRVSEETWFYRMHSNNAHLNIGSLETDILKIYKKAEGMKLFKNTSFRNKCYSNVYFMLAGSFWSRGNNRIKTIKYLLKSIFTYPPMLIVFINKLTHN